MLFAAYNLSFNSPFFTAIFKYSQCNAAGSGKFNFEKHVKYISKNYFDSTCTGATSKYSFYTLTYNKLRPCPHEREKIAWFLGKQTGFLEKHAFFKTNNCSETEQKNLCLKKLCVFTKIDCFFKSLVFFSRVTGPKCRFFIILQFYKKWCKLTKDSSIKGFAYLVLCFGKSQILIAKLIIVSLQKIEGFLTIVCEWSKPWKWKTMNSIIACLFFVSLN